jgi:hypothetical protein
LQPAAVRGTLSGHPCLVNVSLLFGPVQCAKRPFAAPTAVLAYLSGYTHRVAISNSRLLALDECGVSFRWKDYRNKHKTLYKAMTLDPGEFMRHFLLHVLPGGFHRIRHYGLLANGAARQV